MINDNVELNPQVIKAITVPTCNFDKNIKKYENKVIFR